jgi:hypothetical protein
MKTIYTSLFTLLFAATLQATTITAVVNNGQWDVNSTWNLNRQPQNNDTIVIPVGFTVVLDQHITLNNIYLLINGTLRFNGGKFTLNNICSILIQSGGKIIGTSNSEQIRLGGIFKYKGNEGTITGPALANAVSGDGFIPLTLPVKFTGFYAKKYADKIELTWITSEEINNSHFDVQRSIDGQNWKNIAVVFAVTNPGPVNRYQYSDHYTTSHKVYYRLKQVDNDGKSAYSAIKTVNGNESIAASTIFVSSKQTIAIEFNEQVKDKVIVRIYNVNGQPVREQQFAQVTGRIEMHIPQAIPGVYAVQVLNGGNIRDVKKVIL